MYTATPGLKLGAKNHLAQWLREERGRRGQKKAIPCRASTEVSHQNNIPAALCPEDRPASVSVCLLYVWTSACGQLG